MGPGQRSREERRLRRRQQRLQALVVGVALLLGVLVGWLLLGWVIFPRPSGVALSGLDSQTRIQVVESVVEAWGASHDTALAQEQLRDFDRTQVAAILKDLRTAYELSGEKVQADQVTAFAESAGLPLPPVVAVPVAAADPSALPQPTNPPLPVHILVAANAPPSIRAAVTRWAQENNGTLVAPGADADVTVSAEPQAGSILLAERFYVVVDRFATLRTAISSAQVRGLWLGQSTADGASSLLVTPDALEGLTTVLGPPGSSVKPLSLDALITRLWADSTALAIVPFDQLIPRLDALALDGQNILSHDFSPAAYPFVMRTYVGGQSAPAQRLVLGLRPLLVRTNRDPDRITTLVMTGTTAVTRTAAWKIEQKKDPAYPARLIGPTLAAADITHISNEIAFVEDCQPVLNTMSFCSSPSYMATFKLAGVKIVGLTGNHLLDYGVSPFLKTLDTYDAAGMKYYGGGRNAQEAAKPLILLDHGNRLAFIGANSFGPPSVWATAKQPGAQRYDLLAMQQEIADAHKQADVVLVEVQAEETYDYAPSTDNQTRFRALMVSGADVVTGVQAHQPQAFEFTADGRRLILYGLGNLFFDQMFALGVRQELIARHTIYQGRLIQTELLTAMLEDSVQPRWMTPNERSALLRSVFAASGWK
ncbi:MAG: CapA family protein [Anaerolineae bacterium]